MRSRVLVFARVTWVGRGPRHDRENVVVIGALRECPGAVHLDVATLELASTHRLQPRPSKTCDRIP